MSPFTFLHGTHNVNKDGEFQGLKKHNIIIKVDSSTICQVLWNHLIGFFVTNRPKMYSFYTMSELSTIATGSCSHHQSESTRFTNESNHFCELNPLVLNPSFYVPLKKVSLTGLELHESEKLWQKTIQRNYSSNLQFRCKITSCSFHFLLFSVQVWLCTCVSRIVSNIVSVAHCSTLAAVSSVSAAPMESLHTHTRTQNISKG